MTESPLRQVMDSDQLSEVWGAPRAVIFKYSPACWSSRRARREMEAFAHANPAVPVYIIDVLADRPLSEQIAERTGVRHESPQVLMLEVGVVRWTDSHRGVTDLAVTEALQTA